VSIGVGVAANLLTSWLLDQLAKSLAETPPPTVERVQLWAARDVRGGSVLDLIAAELPKEVQDLKERRQLLLLQLLGFWAQLDHAPADARPSLLEAATKQLLEDRRQLFVAANNVSTALESEHRFADSAQAAADLERILSQPLVYSATAIYGRLSVAQIEQARTNLRWYQASIRRQVIAPLHELDSLIREAINTTNLTLAQFQQSHAAINREPIVAPRNP
jgi:hypothetical protein